MSSINASNSSNSVNLSRASSSAISTTLSNRMMSLSIGGNCSTINNSSQYSSVGDRSTPPSPKSPNSPSNRGVTRYSASPARKLVGDLKDAICLIEDRLYWVSLRRTPSTFDNPQTTFIMLDDKYSYEPFCHDFGPVNIGHTVNICRSIDNQLQTSNKKIVLVTSFDGQKRANGAFLAAAYMVIAQNKSPEDAARAFTAIYPPLIPFRDASQSLSTFSLSVLDCCKGLTKAISLNFFNYNTFDTEEYLKLEKVENGDINWVVPGKFLAFSSPSSRRITSDGYVHWTPEDYISPFRQWKLSAVVRLNRPLYDRKKFVTNGVNHHDLYFPDGSTPNEDIIRKFLQICEEESVIAVHCKAGLGRTGTMIALYMMKQYQFTATEAIGWLRICRPGMVIGIQQQFLKEKQAKMWREGEDRTQVLPLSVTSTATERLFPLQVVSMNTTFEKPKNLIEYTPPLHSTPPKTRQQLSIDLSRKFNDEKASQVSSPSSLTPKRLSSGSSSARSSFSFKEPSTPPRSENSSSEENRKEFDSPITPIKVKYDRKYKDITSPASAGRAITTKPMSTRGLGRIIGQGVKEQRAMTPPKSFLKASHLVNDVTHSLNFSELGSGSLGFSVHTPQKRTHHIDEVNHKYERKSRDNFLLVGNTSRYL